MCNVLQCRLWQCLHWSCQSKIIIWSNDLHICCFHIRFSEIIWVFGLKRYIGWSTNTVPQYKDKHSRSFIRREWSLITIANARYKGSGELIFPKKGTVTAFDPGVSSSFVAGDKDLIYKPDDDFVSRLLSLYPNNLKITVIIDGESHELGAF